MGSKVDDIFFILQYISTVDGLDCVSDEDGAEGALDEDGAEGAVGECFNEAEGAEVVDEDAALAAAFFSLFSLV